MNADEARRALIAAAEETEAQLRSLGADIASIVDARLDANSDDEHDPEGTTLAYERSQADAIRTSAITRLDEISAALARMDARTFGFCEVCASPIAEGRLEARPWASRCVLHA
jgi:DnaK suppressor protein